MAAFEYEALDAAGKRTRGLLSADSEAAARKELRRRRLAPLSVSRASEKGAGANPVANLFKPGGLSEDDLTGVTRQLATLIDAGMPVEEAEDAAEVEDAVFIKLFIKLFATLVANVPGFLRRLLGAL